MLITEDLLRSIGFVAGVSEGTFVLPGSPDTPVLYLTFSGADGGCWHVNGGATTVRALPELLTALNRSVNWPPTGDQGFYNLLWQMAELHARKSADYGGKNDLLANVRGAREFGVPNWVGIAMRMNDKVIRLKSMARNGRLHNESLQDSLMDIACYALLALRVIDLDGEEV